MITFQNVTKRYKNDHYALKNVSLQIHSGEFVFIVGASGAGKSTLMKLLYSEEKPTSGIVSIGGLNIANLTNDRIPNLRRCMGIVFQDYKLLPKLTAYENVAYPLESYGMSSSEIRPLVMNALKHVGLKDKTRSFPHQLSGGEQQRVCIARAIVNKPKLLLCDEPTGNLDPETSKEIMGFIEKINKDLGTTVVMATHDKDIVNRMKKRVVVVQNGLIEGDYLKGSYKVSENI